MKKLITRTLTGCVYMALIVIPLIVPTSYAFLNIFILFTIWAISEFNHLIIPRVEGNRMTRNIISATDILGGSLMFSAFYWKYSDPTTETLWLAPSILYLISRLVIQLYLKSDTDPLRSLAYSFMGQIYIALPLSLLNILYFECGAKILLAVFIFIWINDTGAFCVGSLLGKHRLFERISPKKSWEGFWGGLIFCIIASVVFYLCNEFFMGPDLIIWIGFGIIVSVFATWGDLCESQIKRTLNVKDSGKSLPGHGGILDRIDSLLLVSPAVLLYFIVISFLSNM